MLAFTYRTSDDRFVALCMLQADKYWPRFCEVVGKTEWLTDPRYADGQSRQEHIDECLVEMKELFGGKTLAEWKAILSSQDGQWDVVQEVGEIHRDVQVQANNLVQAVDCGDGTAIPLVAVPMIFDGEAFAARGSPELGAHSDAILEQLGFDEDAIIDLNLKGVVF